MKNQLKTLISALKATPYTQLQAADHRGRSYDRITMQLAAATDHTVMGGPYRGMKYFTPAGIPIVDKLPAAKLIGSFEEELHPWIDRLTACDFKTVVHIGSGEGYHAVGMARRMSNARFVVFDTLIAARQACHSLADQNGVRPRIQLWGFCGAQALVDMELAGSLVFSDCGGAELTLLDPTVYPALRLATILVETHDAFDDRITPRLMARFSGTHRIEFVASTERDPARYTLPASLDQDAVRGALDERRKLTKSGKAQTWALLTPYSS